MSAELLLEIGTEEIPSGYLDRGLNEFRHLAEISLEENRIHIQEALITHGTPRRLILIGRAVSEQQEDLVEEALGPPQRVAYDGAGEPTKAALGFAQRQGVPVEALGVKDTPKGAYLYAQKKVVGRATKDVLAEVLPGLISRIPWPKSMRWGSLDFQFVRPIQWVLALFQGEVIPFELADIQSGNTTHGHRFMNPEEQKVVDVQDYLEKMAASHVMVDPRERIQEVEKLTREAAKNVGGSPGHDPELVRTVANLIEYPSAVCGHFDRDFLGLPDPVLITAMREHQKYFAVQDDRQRLMPNFVAVNNTVTRDEEVARRGHERVLRARLSDAMFFFKEDRKRGLEERLEDLKGVIYQAQLGTSHMKVLRFTKLAEFLTALVCPEKLGDVCLAARLCKADLVTQMVTEFPTLQGVMGEGYARLEGRPENVCLAIREHYLPAKAGGALPLTDEGALVGLADRMDTICGCFSVGLEPSGSADPFALRRHALAIIRILEEKSWDVSLKAFIQQALHVLEEGIPVDREKVFPVILNFFRERYKQRMLRSDYDSDMIEAVISVHFDRIHRIGARLDQLRRFYLESRDFQGLAMTFKRISNMLKKQAGPFHVDSSFFREPCESTLFDICDTLESPLNACLQKGDYTEALTLLVRFKKPVDGFFEGVEILTKEDERLKQNRVSLLHHVAEMFLRVADLSKFTL